MGQGAQLKDLPPEWQRHVKVIRSECRRYRLALRAAEAELAELKGQTDGA
jgi:hypothetical protein